MLYFQWQPFSALNADDLYAILALRANVFVVEQHCFYLDPDGKDIDALHLLGKAENQLVAYARLFLPTNKQHALAFGRVATAPAARRQGYGKKLMQELLRYCHTEFPGVDIICSAQHYLQKFYENAGFSTDGSIYQEDGIPHIAMRKKA